MGFAMKCWFMQILRQFRRESMVRKNGKLKWHLKTPQFKLQIEEKEKRIEETNIHLVCKMGCDQKESITTMFYCNPFSITENSLCRKFILSCKLGRQSDSSLWDATTIWCKWNQQSINRLVIFSSAAMRKTQPFIVNVTECAQKSLLNPS